jgi:hypothetical protein
MNLTALNMEMIVKEPIYKMKNATKRKDSRNRCQGTEAHWQPDTCAGGAVEERTQVTRRGGRNAPEREGLENFHAEESNKPKVPRW